MGKKNLRQQELIKLIKIHGMLPVKTLSAMLQVSEMTVRRDLESLQEEPAITAEQEAGGDRQVGPYNLLQALQNANEQKDRIGKFAASLIQPGDVIIIDTGSTTSRILPHIPTDANLTVLCFNANVLFDLRYNPGIQLLFCGGVYHPNTQMFESPEGIRFIERTRANKVFLSAAGIHRELGLTCANDHEIPTKNAILRSSSQRILVADSSKFGQLRSSYFCDLSDVHCIVTDSDLSEDWKAYIESLDITLYLV